MLRPTLPYLRARALAHTLRLRSGVAPRALGAAIALAASLSGAASLGCGVSDSATPERVILVVVDTLRADAPSYAGGKADTPVLDALAERGQVYPNAVSSFHGTTMSMAALFTGRTPSIETGVPAQPLPVTGRTWCGMARFPRQRGEQQCIPASLPNLAEAMRSAGYFTIGVSSNPLLFAPFGLERGFDDWQEEGIFVPLGMRLSSEQLRTAQHSRSAAFVLPALETALARRKSDRFFLYVHVMEAHDHNGTPQDYERAVRDADRTLGRIFELLEREQLMEQSLIVFTSDHGERMGEQHVLPGGPLHAGNPAFDELLRVPLIVAPPGADDPQRSIRSEDVYRLILARTGAASEAVSGLSEGELFLTELRWLTYRSGGFKSYYRRSDGQLVLVDLAADAGETVDVSATHPDIARAHRERIEALSAQLATRDRAAPITDEDKARLKTLGYLDEADDHPSPP